MLDQVISVMDQGDNITFVCEQGIGSGGKKAPSLPPTGTKNIFSNIQMWRLGLRDILGKWVALTGLRNTAVHNPHHRVCFS